MRIKLIDSIFFLYFIAFVTIIFMGLSFDVFSNKNLPKKHHILPVKQNTKVPIKHLSKMVTVCIREFEPTENDVTLTAHSFMNIFPTMQIFILYDELPYPPLDILTTNNSLPNVKFVKLMPSLKTAYGETYPLNQIKTKYILFVPDSTRITSRQSLQIMLSELHKKANNILVASVRSQKNLASCLMIDINVREWTLKYSKTNKKVDCDGISGKHLILIEVETLQKLANAFLLPFPQSLYIQTAALSLKVSNNIPNKN